MKLNQNLIDAFQHHSDSQASSLDAQNKFMEDLSTEIQNRLAKHITESNGFPFITNSQGNKLMSKVEVTSLFINKNHILNINNDLIEYLTIQATSNLTRVLNESYPDYNIEVVYLSNSVLVRHSL